MPESAARDAVEQLIRKTRSTKLQLNMKTNRKVDLEEQGSAALN